MSGLKTAFSDFPLTILLTIANKVSNIGRARTINGATKTIAVYVFATPSIDIIAKLKPKNCAPTSPMNVFAGLKLYGKNPSIAPAKAVINTVAITGDPFNEKIIIKDMHEINVIPEDNPI